MQDTIKIYFTDFWQGFDLQDNIFMPVLRKIANVTVDAKNPDFLFHSCFGFEHINYDCVKICYLGENLSPDFNISDYALGFDFLSFEDRYLRFPLYRFYMVNHAYMTQDFTFFQKEISQKNTFCNFIYSNGRNSAPERDMFFHKLTKYKKIDSGGRHLNNIGGCVDDKLEWQRKYKFSIAFENSLKSGYSTEKIYDALVAHTIPIYWGNPRIAEDFNAKRFINCHDFPSFEAVIEHVKYLDTNTEAYVNMLAEPWFNDDAPPLPQDDTQLCAFLKNIFEQNPKAAKRTTINGFTYEHLQRQNFLYKLRMFVSLFTRRNNIKHKLFGK